MTNKDIPDKSKPQLLLVDDEVSLLKLFQRTLGRSGYVCKVAQDGKDALTKLAQQPFDVVLTDIDMPVMDGVELTRRISESYNSSIIVMTGKIDKYKYNQLIRLGASDFVEKPFSVDEIELRIKRVLNERLLRAKAEASHKKLKKAYIDSIHRLVLASEFKDEDTGEHIMRMGEYSRFMAEKLNFSADNIQAIYYASPMHDIGKIGIPDHILLKPGKLTTDEFKIIKTHTTIGATLLSRSESPILKMAEEIALNHHEQFSGKGYPQGLSGEDIPLSGRIVAVIDTFDALMSKRPYKDPYPPERTYDVIKEQRGKQFDPSITDLFLDNFTELVSIRENIKPLGPFLLDDPVLKLKLNEDDAS